ncbi:MAG: PAS domain S-box protein [Verrucomicrobia bacterium]|nr:PAS domain S-box protein [Verrucomicrobiota bacterium]
MNSAVINPLVPKRPSRSDGARPWLAFGVCLLIGIALTWRAAATRAERARTAAHAEARARLAALELGFAGAFRAVELIAHSVREGNGRTPDFQRIAADLLRQHPALATIELQPGGVTTEVAPRAGHERLVGRNLMADPVGREAALFSLQRRNVTVTGPTVLTDGQLGLLVRQPVFLGAGPGREQPWGFVTAAARFREPLRHARFDELASAGYQFALFTAAAPLQPAGTVLSTFRTQPTDALIQPLRLANLELRLGIRPTAGWHNSWLIAFHALLALAVAAAMGGATHWRQAARAASLASSEADLRAARDNDRFRALFDTVPDAALLVDRPGTIQRVNSAAEQLFAKRAAEIGGQSINSIVPGLAALLNAASRSLTQPAIQLTGLRAGTVEFPVEIRVTPLPSAESGNLVCCWIREVAAAPPAPPAPTSAPAPGPETKPANVQPLLDAIPHPVFVKDSQARFVTCNRAYERTFGLTAESLRGRTVLELEDLPEETRRNFYAEDQAVIAEGSQRSYELPIVRADGSARTVIYAVAGYRLPEGGPGGLVGILTDITPQKEAEQERRKLAAELERARLLSETVLELTGFASWRVPLDGSGAFHSSPPAAALMGDPPQPAHHYRLQEHWFAHARAADAAAAQAALKQLEEVVAGLRATYDATYAYRRPADGRIVWLRATGRLIKDDAGRPLEIFGVVSDITESRRLAAELEAARAQAREASLALAAALAGQPAVVPARGEGEVAETEKLSRARGAAVDVPPIETPPDTNLPSRDAGQPIKVEPIAVSGQSVGTERERGGRDELSEPDVATIAGSPVAPPAETRDGDRAEVAPPPPRALARKLPRNLPASCPTQKPQRLESPLRTRAPPGRRCLIRPKSNRPVTTAGPGVPPREARPLRWSPAKLPRQDRKTRRLLLVQANPRDGGGHRATNNCRSLARRPVPPSLRIRRGSDRGPGRRRALSRRKGPPPLQWSPRHQRRLPRARALTQASPTDSVRKSRLRRNWRPLKRRGLAKRSLGRRRLRSLRRRRAQPEERIRLPARAPRRPKPLSSRPLRGWTPQKDCGGPAVTRDFF